MIYATEHKLNCASRMHYVFESLFFNLPPPPSLFVTHLCTIDPWCISSALEYRDVYCNRSAVSERDVVNCTPVKWSGAW